MKLFTSTTHAPTDYPSALVLIVAPFVMGMAEVSALAQWASIGVGVLLISYSLLTDYTLSIWKVIPFRVHLGLDWALLTALVSLPFLLDLTGPVRIYFLVVGFGGFLANSLWVLAEIKASRATYA